METILDEYIIIDEPIVDYRTPFSGITSEILKKAKYTFKEI